MTTSKEYIEGYNAYMDGVALCPYNRYDGNVDEQRRQNTEWWKGWNEAEKIDIPSVLERLEKAYIFEVQKINDNEFVFKELCDSHFTKSMTRDDLLQLAQELDNLAS